MARAAQRTQFVSPLYQLILIVIGSLILTFFIQRRLQQFRAFETESSIKVFTPNEEQGILGSSNEVQVGFYIHEFRKFDVIKRHFTFASIVWFLFDPAMVKQEDIDRFHFMSATIDERSKPIIKKVNGKQFVSYQVVCTVFPKLQYTDFPIDDHRIYITLINPAISAKDIVFKVALGDFTVGSDETAIGWQLVGQWVRTGNVKLELDAVNKDQDMLFPAATFALDYSQFNIRDLMTLFLPLLLLCYIGFFSFSLDQSTAFTIIPLTVTGILAYRFVIDSLSPRVGYFMLIDKMFLLLLLIAGITLIMMIIESYKDVSTRIIKIILALLHVITVICLVGFIR